MSAHENQQDMETLLQQLDEWAEGEGDLPIGGLENSEAVTYQQKRQLWQLLNQPEISVNTIQHPGMALR